MKTPLLIDWFTHVSGIWPHKNNDGTIMIRLNGRRFAAVIADNGVPHRVAADNLGVGVLHGPLQVPGTVRPPKRTDHAFPHSLLLLRLFPALHYVNEQDAEFELRVLQGIIEGLVEDHRGVGSVGERLARGTPLDLDAVHDETGLHEDV